MKSRYLVLLFSFVLISCGQDSFMGSPKSKKIDISDGIPIEIFIGLTSSATREKGDIVSEETSMTMEFNNAVFFLFDKIESKGIITWNKKKITEYSERNSDETNYTEKIIKDQEITKGMTGKQPFEEKEISDIEGETFLYKKFKNKWEIKLLNENPTPKQNEILRDKNISMNSWYSCIEQNNLNKKIKLGEKLMINQRELCLFGVDKFGKFNDLSLTFTDTSSVDGISYAHFLLLGEAEMTMDKLGENVKTGSIQSERKSKELSIKANFIGKITFCMDNNLIEKFEVDMNGKGKGTTVAMDMELPIEFEASIKGTIKSELLNRKK
jgi:hypothetical protein